MGVQWHSSVLVAVLLLGSAAAGRGQVDTFPVLNEPPWRPETGFVPAGDGTTNVGGLQVDTSVRAEVRAFFNAVYRASDGTPMLSSVNPATCTPGTNSTAYQESVIRRINWFRTMAGVPAGVTLDATFTTDAQRAALMMSAQGALSHTPTNGWSCWTAAGSNAAYNCNLALDAAGAEAITTYMDDFGAENASVGHRRWLLYPQTQVMGTGDVPGGGTKRQANATWIVDANFSGPRPTTRRPEVAWPPAGYVPYPVVFRRWSFSYPGASFGLATVTMTSNGVPMSVVQQATLNGYGENTLAWVPGGLDPNSPGYRWPRPATNISYTVTLSNVLVRGNPSNFTYTVTVFDPDVPGPGELPATVAGATYPALGQSNWYTVQPVTGATRYEWRQSRKVPMVFYETVDAAATNWVIAISPGYNPVPPSAGVSSTRGFHLAHPQPPTLQTLTLRTVFTPATNGLLVIRSKLGYAGTSQWARVQVSTDNGVGWRDVYSQRGTGGAGETAYVIRNIGLGAFVGQSLKLRFAYEFLGGSYYAQTNGTYGWLLDNIQLTNATALVSSVVSVAQGPPGMPGFAFQPSVLTNHLLEARGLLFDEFPLAWGPLREVIPVVPPQLFPPVRSGSQWRLEFLPGSVAVSKVRLQTAEVAAGPWSTNVAATLDTNSATGRPRFTVPAGAENPGLFRLYAPSP